MATKRHKKSRKMKDRKAEEINRQVAKNAKEDTRQERHERERRGRQKDENEFLNLLISSPSFSLSLFLSLGSVLASLATWRLYPKPNISQTKRGRFQSKKKPPGRQERQEESQMNMFPWRSWRPGGFFQNKCYWRIKCLS